MHSTFYFRPSSEEEMMVREEVPGFSYLHEDATNLVCGLIRELSSLKLVSEILHIFFNPTLFLLLVNPLCIQLLVSPYRAELLTSATIGHFHPFHIHLCTLIGWSVVVSSVSCIG